MNRLGFGKRWLAGAVLLVGGCGAVPDFLVDAGRDAAKKALEESARQAVEQVVNGFVDDLWDSNDVFGPLAADDEDVSDADRRR